MMGFSVFSNESVHRKKHFTKEAVRDAGTN